MKRPTDDQFNTAIEWLMINEGDQGEMEDCRAVSVWLKQEMHERMLRQEARKGGVTVARLRRAMLADRCGT